MGGTDWEGMEGGGLSLKNLRTIRSFKNPVFRLYFGAMLGQMAGMNMQQITRSLLIYRLTGSATFIGVLSLCFALPLLFFSIFGGVIADRVQKKYVLIIGQAGSALVCLCVGLSLQLGYLSADIIGSWWILAVTSVFQGTIMALMMPSRQTLIPEIVGEEGLFNAVALNTLGMNGMRLMAPALAGFLIDGIGFEAVYYVMAGFYIMSVLLVLPMPPFATPLTIKGQGALRSVKEAFQYLLKETHIIWIMLVTLLGIIFMMPYMLLMPIFADDILKVGATGMGILITFSGIGAIATSIVLASLPNKKRGAMLLISNAAMGIALVGFAFSTSLPLSLTLMVFVGVGTTILMATSFSLILHYTAYEYRGRVMSIMMTQFGLTSLGTFFCSVLAANVGVQWAVGSFAMTLIALSSLAIVLLPRIRKLD